MNALLYDLGMSLLKVTFACAGWFSAKAHAFRSGRKEQAGKLRETFPLPAGAPLVWFHCASLGEFEQGRPVIEKLKRWRPDLRILLTFFSPSGYEVRKDYPIADFVFYLPWDSRSNALFFATRVRPALAVFVKYEFWYHYSQALNDHGIPLISISAIFHPTHVYFKRHGFIFRSILRNFSHFFVQNQESLDLLKGIGITGATISGDTRFDRVREIADQAGENSLVQRFKGDKKVMVIGSAWPDDMAVLLPFMNEHKDSLKFVVAPHELSDSFITSIEKEFHGTAFRYTRTNIDEVEKAGLLLVDTIGMLSQLYRYGEFAFVGGGYKEGLHNILEAACYGIPVFFGNKANYDKYQEAVDLVQRGGAFAVGDTSELTTAYRRLIESPPAYLQAAEVTRAYVNANLGATTIITQHLQRILEAWKGA